MKIIYSLCTMLLFCFHSNGQKFQKTTQGIKTMANSHNIEIQFYSPAIVRVIKFPEATKFSKESLSVVLKPAKTSFSVKTHGDIIFLKSDKLTVSVNTVSGDVAFASADNELLKEKSQGTKFEPFDDTGVKTFTVTQSFILDKEEPIYGLGQHQRGDLNQRNQKYHLEQGNVDDAVTFFQSIKGYGLYWDNYSPTEFTDDATQTSFKSIVGDGVDYYFMYGGNADGVIGKMRELTGKVPMFPLWIYGFWQSKERYKSQNELVEVVKKYRELSVPLDGIIQDWQYWGNNYLWNAMEFLNPEFSDPKKMVDEVHNLNAHMIISIWSSFGRRQNPIRKWIKMECYLILKPGQNPVQKYGLQIKIILQALEYMTPTILRQEIFTGNMSIKDYFLMELTAGGWTLQNRITLRQNQQIMIQKHIWDLLEKCEMHIL